MSKSLRSIASVKAVAILLKAQIYWPRAQGLGYALCEEIRIEEGRVMVSSLGDYKICCVRDVPPLVTSFVAATVGPGPFSAKSVGEAGISIVAPAIANAVYDATGVRIKELPMTAEKLFKELTAGGFRSGANGSA